MKERKMCEIKIPLPDTDISFIKISLNLFKFIFFYLSFCCILQVFKFNFFYFSIIYIILIDYSLIFFRTTGLLIFYFILRNFNNFSSLVCPRNFVFKNLNIKNVRKYFFFKKYLCVYSRYILYILLYIYNCYFILLIYLVFSFILSLDDLNINLNRATLGIYYNNIPLIITSTGREKLIIFNDFVINNYFVDDYHIFMFIHNIDFVLKNLDDYDKVFI